VGRELHLRTLFLQLDASETNEDISYKFLQDRIEVIVSISKND